MEGLDKAVEVLTDARLLFAFVVVIIPGFLAVRAYQAIRGVPQRSINESLIDVMVYGLASTTPWVPGYFYAEKIVDPQKQLIALILLGFVALIVTPIVLAGLCGIIVDLFVNRGIIANPDVKPWDRIFKQISSSKLDVGIVLTLPDGRKIGGRFGTETASTGFASSYPADEQILIGELWNLNPDGTFSAKMTGTRGMLIDKKDVLAVEFVDWNAVLATIKMQAQDVVQPPKSAQQMQPGRTNFETIEQNGES